MADISTELANIMSAIYGEEVRTSIHDAIQKMNTQLNSAASNTLNGLGFKGDLGTSDGTTYNLNSLTTTSRRGIWRLQANRNYTNAPEDYDQTKTGYLIIYSFGTVDSTASNIKQEIHYFSDSGANANVCWSRVYISGSWTEWKKNVDSLLMTEGAAADAYIVGTRLNNITNKWGLMSVMEPVISDIDQIIAQGIYYVMRSSAPNWPFDNPGLLLVLNAHNANRETSGPSKDALVQMTFVDGAMAYRIYGTNTWGEWTHSDTDASLSIEGSPADAKAVGDKALISKQVYLPVGDNANLNNFYTQGIYSVMAPQGTQNWPFENTSGMLIVLNANNDLGAFITYAVAQIAICDGKYAFRSSVIGQSGPKYSDWVIYSIDDTLSIEGAAADAKAVGDAISGAVENVVSSKGLAMSTDPEHPVKDLNEYKTPGIYYVGATRVTNWAFDDNYRGVLVIFNPMTSAVGMPDSIVQMAFSNGEFSYRMFNGYGTGQTELWSDWVKNDNSRLLDIIESIADVDSVQNEIEATENQNYYLEKTAGTTCTVKSSTGTELVLYSAAVTAKKNYRVTASNVASIDNAILAFATRALADNVACTMLIDSTGSPTIDYSYSPTQDGYLFLSKGTNSSMTYKIYEVEDQATLKTDKTLSIENMPADAKVVGDIKAAVPYNYGTNIPLNFTSCDDINIDSCFFVSTSASGVPIIADWPFDVWPGWIITTLVGNSTIHRSQIAICWSKNRIKQRTMTTNVWQPWGEYVSDISPIKLNALESCDLNTVINKNATYLLIDSNSYTNTPSNQNIGWLIVQYTYTWTAQIFISLSDKRMWHRFISSSGAVYRDWQCVSTTPEVDNIILYGNLAGSLPIKWDNRAWTSDYNGVIVTNNNGVMHFSGTQVNAQLNRNVFVNATGFPEGMESGGKYYLSILVPNRERSFSDYRFAAYINKVATGSANWQYLAVCKPNDAIELNIPSDACGFLLRYEIPVSGTILDDDIYVSLTKSASAQWLSKKALTGENYLPSCDLNSLYGENSFYILIDSQTYDNMPTTDVVGFLQTITSSNWTLQIFYRFYGGKMWTRRSSSVNSWTDWVLLAGGEEKHITNEYVTNHYTNTYNVTATPSITTDTNNYLASPGDTSDMTSAIQTLLNTTGVCNLGPGTFYVTGIDIPDYGTLRGCGAKTVIRLADSVTDGYAVRFNSWGTLSDIRFVGSSNWAPPSNGVVRTRHAVLFEGNYDGDRNQLPKTCQISNLYISDFAGGGITCNNTGYDYDKCLNVVNCFIWNCDAGINIAYWSEFNRFTNVSCHACYYGCINNGGNNTFHSCDFSGNRYIAVLMDNTDTKSPNNAHGSMIGCIMNHTNSNTGIGIKVINCHNGFIFSGCQLFFSQIVLEDSYGINISDTNFGLNNCDITITGGGLMIFANNIHQGRPPITIANNQNVHFVNCYSRGDGSLIQP